MLGRALRALGVIVLVALTGEPVSATARLPLIALQFPVTGIDGGAGLRMRDAALQAVDDLHAAGIQLRVATPTGAEAVENPHQDEGSDNEADVAAGPRIVREAARARTRVIVGPLRSNVAVAETQALRESGDVAITGTAGAPSVAGSRVFKLAPSERQLARAAYAWMRRHFGPRICVIDDRTDDGMRRAAALRAAGPTVAGRDCVARSDAVYFATNPHEPVFCSSATARRADVHLLLVEVSHRAFDPAQFSGAGELFRAEAAPIVRTPSLDALSQRYHARAFVAADDGALRTYAAVEVAAQILHALRPGEDPAHVARTHRFRTVIGSVRFDDSGDRRAAASIIRRLN